MEEWAQLIGDDSTSPSHSGLSPQFDIVRPDPERVHVPVRGWIQRELAVSLFKGAGLDFEAAKKRAQDKVVDTTPMYHLIRDIANSGKWPTWNADSEFRAERGKTASARAAAMDQTGNQSGGDVESRR